ncbi:hypothetical protein GCM10009863_36070 [Streptomyces axinellae]|uniref:Uncharacterized protein n=1 Tax=Streptomyces axinellae TaxID=552788 RepID=A0ABP6CLU6_9ACTN
MADLALLLEQHRLAELVGERYLRIGADEVGRSGTGLVGAFETTEKG